MQFNVISKVETDWETSKLFLEDKTQNTSVH